MTAGKELADVLDPDVVYELPQTRERIRGRDRYVTFNADGESSLPVAFFEVSNGRITKVTDLWPEPYDPPPGREHLVERW